MAWAIKDMKSKQQISSNAHLGYSRAANSAHLTNVDTARAVQLQMRSAQITKAW
jgi:hypothetical protein